MIDRGEVEAAVREASPFPVSSFHWQPDGAVLVTFEKFNASGDQLALPIIPIDNGIAMLARIETAVNAAKAIVRATAEPELASQ